MKTFIQRKTRYFVSKQWGVASLLNARLALARLMMWSRRLFVRHTGGILRLPVATDRPLGLLRKRNTMRSQAVRHTSTLTAFAGQNSEAGTVLG